MSKTHGNYGLGVVRPKINDKTHFELKGKYLKELRENTFSGFKLEDANEHIKKVLEIVDLFHILEVTQDQVMLRVFSMSLTGAAIRWLRNEPSGSITNWETLKMKFLNKYCPLASTTKKMEEINNFQQEPDESLFRAWKRFKELLMKCPQHYLTDMQEVILFYNGLDVPTRQILDSKAQLNNLGREIKKVNEKVYAAQVGCELSKGPHYTKDCPLKEEVNTLKEAYYTQFGAPYQPVGQYRATGPGLRMKILPIRNQGASIKTLEIQIGQMSKVLQERGIRGLPGSTKPNPKDHVKSISTTKANSSKIRRMGYSPYTVSGSQRRSIFSETVPLPRRLQNYCCNDWREAQDV
ncbi:gypsy/ty3 retroelement polyprotein [Tanacetum coccineum]